MFAYCGNNPVIYTDPAGTIFRQAFAASCYDRGGSLCDYVIYYFHPESSENLDGPATQNHKATNSKLMPVGSFDELVDALNNIPCSIDDIYIYLHSNEDYLSFYYANYYNAMDIANNLVETPISGEIYLFSCKGGRGELASSMSVATNRTVVASVYKVSFGDGFARCGWKDYFWYSLGYSKYSWYSYYPDGSKKATSIYRVFTE